MRSRLNCLACARMDRLIRSRAKRADTAEAWINSIFLVMNLQILLRIFFALWKKAAAALWLPLLHVAEWVLPPT